MSQKFLITDPDALEIVQEARQESVKTKKTENKKTTQTIVAQWLIEGYNQYKKRKGKICR